MNKRDIIAEQVLKELLDGQLIYRDDINKLGEDANYVINCLRNQMLIPVVCKRAKQGEDAFWFIPEKEIGRYNDQKERSAQRNEQRKYIDTYRLKRNIKNTHDTLQSLNVPIPKEFTEKVDSLFGKQDFL